MKIAEFTLVMLMAFISIPSSGAFVTADARSRSLASADAALTSDASGWSNPAALSFLEKPCISLQAENPWCISELATGAVSLCVPTKSGTFALSFSRYGFVAFHETQAGVSFGKSLCKKVKAGINLEYRRIKQYAEYGSLYAIIPSAGIQVLPVPDLVLGLKVFNPAGQGYYPHGYMKLPAVIKAGIAYQPDPDILFCFELNSETGCKPVYSGGVEYNYEKQFILRLGLSSAPYRQYSLGIGYLGKHLKTDLAVSHHPVLGFSPIITLSIEL